MRHFETVTDGRMRLVIDPEDGSHPQYVYGKDKDEILHKLARTVEHGSRTIAALKSSVPTRHAASVGNAATLPAPRKAMTPDQQMQATSDLANPAKAPQAVKALVNEATGGALDEFEEFRQEKKIKRLASTAASWATRHPEFLRTETNKKLLCDSAVLRVGIENVTEDVLQAVYLELLEGGYLQTDNPDVQLGETPAPRTVREREATSYRRNSLRAAIPVPSTQLKYTRAQVDALSADAVLEKYKTDADFRRAFDTYSQPRTATA